MNYSREHTTLNERILLARLDEQAPASTDTLRIPAGSTWIHLQSTADKLRNCGLGEQSIYQGLRDFLAEYSILHFIKRHGPLTKSRLKVLVNTTTFDIAWGNLLKSGFVEIAGITAKGTEKFGLVVRA